MRKKGVNGDLDELESKGHPSLTEVGLPNLYDEKFSMGDAGLTQRKATSNVTNLKDIKISDQHATRDQQP
jgi:hypothetical protein